MQNAHSQFVTETRMNFHNQGAQIRSLETQVIQIAQMLSERQMSAFPSNFEVNLRRDPWTNVIRSHSKVGKILRGQEELKRLGKNWSYH